ncbi:MAG: outer membrane beta-barrel protein [Candidatus Korobacteraceae bacterium]
MKHKLIFITVLALGSMAHAQGFLSNLSLGAGGEGIFPGSSFTRSAAINSFGTNNTTQSTSNSIGGLGDVRYDFGRHSAFDLSVTVNRSTEYSEYSGEYPEFIQSNNFELIGSYIIRLPAKEHLKPYFLVGGGMVHFSPNNNFSTGLTPSSQFKPAFAYGFGTDLPVSDHWAVRLQYRGLVRGEPNFGLAANNINGFGSGLKTNVAEPSIAFIYHF